MQLFIYLFASVVAFYYTLTIEQRDFGTKNMTYSNFVKKKKKPRL